MQFTLNEGSKFIQNVPQPCFATGWCQAVWACCQPQAVFPHLLMPRQITVSAGTEYGERVQLDGKGIVGLCTVGGVQALVVSPGNLTFLRQHFSGQAKSER
jgi:hypothetical protein